ncbi:MAG: M15 family metallopeptidase [Actinomycetia bacterium]|nr:M15 family metallopeptidase [Actinomycetes bacterium]
MASTPSGDGYWLVASDGGVFAYGDARFHGSTGSLDLSRSIVGMASTPSGNGYWMVGSDGGVFSFGDAAFHGSAAPEFTEAELSAIGLVPTSTGQGYLIAATNTAVTAHGDAVIDPAVSPEGFRARSLAAVSGGYWFLGDPVGDIVSVWQSGGLTSVSREAALAAAAELGADATVYHRGTLGLTGVSRDGVVVQSITPGWRVPMSVLAVTPSEAEQYLGALVVSALGRGQVVMGEASARLRGAEVGDAISFIGWDGRTHNREIGYVASPALIGNTELVFSVADAASFGFSRPSSVLISDLPTRQLSLDTLDRHLPDQLLGVQGSWEPPRPNQTLPTVTLKRLLGEFEYRPGSGDSVSIQASWTSTNIASVTVPIVGSLRCHRAVHDDLVAVFTQIEAEGLAGTIDGYDTRVNGGCQVPRLIRGGNSGGALSRHTWGLALDVNPSQNTFGGRVSMNARVVEIFSEHGFVWGGTWTRPDGMHFEWANS